MLWWHICELLYQSDIIMELMEVNDPLKIEVKELCYICDQTFETLEDLENHILQGPHQEIIVNDPAVPNAVLNAPDIPNDGMSILPDNPNEGDDQKYQCNYCDKRFGIYSLDKHTSKVHNLRNKYKCSICDKYFVFMRALMRHNAEFHKKKTAESSGSQSFKCEKCDKSFKRKHHLKDHNDYVHKLIKNHKCDICGRAFGRIEHLRRHLISHKNNKIAGDLPPKVHKCEICERIFPRNSNLQNHLSAHKKGSKRIKPKEIKPQETFKPL